MRGTWVGGVYHEAGSFFSGYCKGCLAILRSAEFSMDLLRLLAATVSMTHSTKIIGAGQGTHI